MPRRRSSRSSGRSSGGFFGSRRASTATPARRAPPPAQKRSAPAPAQQQQSSGGMGSGIGSMLMQGMVWGAASSVGHRAVDAVMGPRTMNVEHQYGDQKAPAESKMQGGAPQAPPAEQFNCNTEMADFNRCVTDNKGDIGSCQYYFDLLNQCNTTAADAKKQWN
eukprot:CAMPEP_0197522566 /NCGR_PEP_ID=MMETSP1318-20131121/7684_1 /TAXON_ID=552666 /ORGANISM="Partenskyella glossopodia, Strain RCC365" /LENGTH=163 /DNA_ID=CAMNT_0043074981 /DNA_START=45 /DNA_END=536 /DNA_ORIENTATION=-